MNQYNEENLIEIPAVNIFKDLGYEYKNYNKTILEEDGTGRMEYNDVVLSRVLKEALVRINKGVSEEAIRFAVLKLTEKRGHLSPEKANREIYELIKNGVKVGTYDSQGKRQNETVTVIDFNNPNQNNFHLARQISFAG